MYYFSIEVSINHQNPYFCNSFFYSVMNIIRQYWLIITLIIVVFLPGSCNWFSKDKTNYTYLNNPDSIQSAISFLSKKIDRRSSNYKLLFDRAKLYEKTDKLQLAVKDMQMLVKHDSVTPKYWNFLGDLIFKAGSAKVAVNCYLKSTYFNPQDEYAFSKLGELYLILQNYEKSFQNLNEALRINKYNPKIYFFKGINYLEMKDTPNAISSFQTAITVAPDYFDAHMNLGILYAAKKDKKALLYYQNALKIKDNSIEVIYAIGKFYQDIDSFDKAITEYNKILSQLPDHKSTNYNMGYISFLKGDFNRAIPYFSTAISKQPDYTDAYYGRGLCYKKTGKTDLAKKDFAKVLQLDPKYELAEKELKKLKKK
jgi:tetratricopeptide (TPR) repeat protein